MKWFQNICASTASSGRRIGEDARHLARNTRASILPEWFEEEGYGPFAPDEELIEHWIAKVERENSKLLQAIGLSFT
jgi:hypothetical protein